MITADRAFRAFPLMSAWARETCQDIYQRSARYGSPTERQMALIEKLVLEAEAKAERPAESAKVDLTRVNELFDRATAKLKKPFCIFATYRKVDGKDVVDAEFKISKAPANGRNPDSLYVKRDGAYQGKIARDGTFQASREAAPKVLDALNRFAADPMAAAVAYGQATGNCARCARKLTNPLSVEIGMGPICRSFFE